MMSEHTRQQKEKVIEEEMKWLEAERNYDVQRAVNPVVRSSGKELQDSGKRNSVSVSK